jgi:hypothetical protein
MAKKKGLKMAKAVVKELALPVEANKETRMGVKDEEQVQYAPKPIVTGPKWVKVTLDEMLKIQKEGKLAGWNPATSEVLINEEE